MSQSFRPVKEIWNAHSSCFVEPEELIMLLHDIAARVGTAIAHRVRRKRQRLPPSLLIENASDRDPAPPQQSAPRCFRSRLATTHPESSPPACNLLHRL